MRGCGPPCNGLPSLNIQRIPRCCTPVREIRHARDASLLYPEKHMTNLVNHLWISTRLTAWEALKGGQHKVRGVFEVEEGLYAIQVIGWLGGVLTILYMHAPLTSPFAIHFNTKLDIQ